MTHSIDEINYDGKPGLHFVDGYTRQDGTKVDGYFRTNPNVTIADNLNTDVDNDGIAGFYDTDADGDGIVDSGYVEKVFSEMSNVINENVNADVMVDGLDVDFDDDGILDVVANISEWLGNIL